MSPPLSREANRRSPLGDSLDLRFVVAHFPKPFFKQARQLWCVEIDRKQHCLGPGKDAAFQQYHALMQVQQRTPLGLAAAGVRSPLVAVLADAFLAWLKATVPQTLMSGVADSCRDSVRSTQRST